MHPLFWGMFVIVIGLFIYLLLRLKRLENLIKGYHLKNQEGLGALSKSRNPLYLLLALLFGILFVLFWVRNGFDRNTLLVLFPVLAFLWLYYNQDEDK